MKREFEMLIEENRNIMINTKIKEHYNYKIKVIMNQINIKKIFYNTWGKDKHKKEFDFSLYCTWRQSRLGLKYYELLSISFKLT